MGSKTLFFVASALFVQSALSQCLGRVGTGLGWDGLGYVGGGNGGLGCGCGGITPAAELAASYGGGLGVASSSCAAPTGLAVASDNMYEGCVGVVGNLPFLGTAGVEGVFPTAGAGAINYGCGDGIVAITSEGPFSGAIAPAAAIGSAGIAPLGLGYRGIAERGCGCGCGSIY